MLRSEIRALLLWLGVAFTYVGWIAVALLVMLQMASGYGFSFLGTGKPPNTAEFRRTVGQFAKLIMPAKHWRGGLSFVAWLPRNAIGRIGTSDAKCLSTALYRPWQAHLIRV
jgi:hypothetical protein